MKLTRVEFINYRSISKDALDIENDVTCLVGINESGKSNVLLALEKADPEEELDTTEYSRHSDGFGNPESSPELKLWFEPTKDELNDLKEIFGTEISTLLLAKTNDGYRIDFPEINYKKANSIHSLHQQECLTSNQILLTSLTKRRERYASKLLKN
jgi:predicted ATP-dependent endonuclease of OLD family